MADFEELDTLPMTGQDGDPAPPADAAKENEKALCKKLAGIIRGDKEHHKKSFDKMRRDMFVARHGRVPEWSDKNYKTNIAGRHVKMKTASLYAKNPKVVARRSPQLDFTVWDENPQTLVMSMQTVQMLSAQVQAAQAAPPSVVEVSGVAQIQPTQPALPPELEQALMQAQAVVADYTQGMERRRHVAKIGKTLEVLFTHAMREQKPVDFKQSLKQLVRRACTTAVGYVELGFQREVGPRPATTERLADARVRLSHLQKLAEDVADGDIKPDDAEMAELEQSITALMQEPEIVLREGLIFDFPKSTRVIPDKLCVDVVGFIGSRHLTIEYLFTRAEVEELFGVDLGHSYAGYEVDGKPAHAASDANYVPDDDMDGYESVRPASDAGLVCVWKHYDKPSGLVYYLADGHPHFLRAPAAPDVFVEDFWPVYALTFNSVESEDCPFPPSDVTLLLDSQNEHNRARQGRREHRNAARPRWATAKGAFDDDDIKTIHDLKPFEIAFLNKDPQSKLADLLDTFPVPGVDPNLYDASDFLRDAQLATGAQEAQYGGVADVTATESAIAAGSTAASDEASKDDLDTFLSTVARAGGQIFLREMSEEQVKVIVGPGAVWPQMTLEEIASEISLEVAAGSTGKPNQAVEIENWTKMAPVLQQTPGVSPIWFAQETIRRLDDRVDLAEAIEVGAPSMVAVNGMKQPATGDGDDPTKQGDNGGQNGPQPDRGAGGSRAAFGSNRM